MASKSKKKGTSDREKRRMRINQILFTVIALMIIIVMLVSLFAKY